MIGQRRTIAMRNQPASASRWLRLGVAAVLAGVCLAALPAKADDDYWRHQPRGHAYGYWRHHERERIVRPPPVYYYEPPRAYYAPPPPAVYVPPPVYGPSFSLTVPLR
jgi:hypothetical protein